MNDKAANNDNCSQSVVCNQVGQTQDVPDVHHAELGTCRATLAFALLLPDLRSSPLRFSTVVITLSGDLVSGRKSWPIPVIVCRSELAREFGRSASIDGLREQARSYTPGDKVND